jgi:hypothetical protein
VREKPPERGRHLSLRPSDDESMEASRPPHAGAVSQSHGLAHARTRSSSRRSGEAAS